MKNSTSAHLVVGTSFILPGASPNGAIAHVVAALKPGAAWRRKDAKDTKFRDGTTGLDDNLRTYDTREVLGAAVGVHLHSKKGLSQRDLWTMMELKHRSFMWSEVQGLHRLRTPNWMRDARRFPSKFREFLCFILSAYQHGAIGAMLGEHEGAALMESSVSTWWRRIREMERDGLIVKVPVWKENPDSYGSRSARARDKNLYVMGPALLTLGDALLDGWFDGSSTKVMDARKAAATAADQVAKVHRREDVHEVWAKAQGHKKRAAPDVAKLDDVRGVDPGEAVAAIAAKLSAWRPPSPTEANPIESPSRDVCDSETSAVPEGSGAAGEGTAIKPALATYPPCQIDKPCGLTTNFNLKLGGQAEQPSRADFPVSSPAAPEPSGTADVSESHTSREAGEARKAAEGELTKAVARLGNPTLRERFGRLLGSLRRSERKPAPPAVKNPPPTRDDDVSRRFHREHGREPEFYELEQILGTTEAGSAIETATIRWVGKQR